MALSVIMEELINAAIADGMITEKERQILRTKGRLEGLNPDEVDLIIDGRLQQIQASQQSTRSKVSKCPVCGEILPALSATCPNCGYVATDTGGQNVGLNMLMSEMETELMLLRNGRVDSSAKLEGLIRQARARYGDNARINALIEEIKDGINVYNREKKAKEDALQAKIRGKKMGCLFWSIGICAFFFLAGVLDTTKSLDETVKAVAGAALICICAYLFYYRRKYNNITD